MGSVVVEAQTFINLAVGLVGFFGGWVINSLSRSIIRIEDRIAELPLIYVSKSDYARDIDEIKGMLTRIFDKLDDKADK